MLGFWILMIFWNFSSFPALPQDFSKRVLGTSLVGVPVRHSFFYEFLRRNVPTKKLHTRPCILWPHRSFRNHGVCWPRISPMVLKRYGRVDSWHLHNARNIWRKYLSVIWQSLRVILVWTSTCCLSLLNLRWTFMIATGLSSFLTDGWKYS